MIIVYGIQFFVMKCIIRVKRVGIYGVKFDNFMVKKIIRCYVFFYIGSVQVDEVGVIVYLYFRGYIKVIAGYILSIGVGIYNENIGFVKSCKVL